MHPDCSNGTRTACGVAWAVRHWDKTGSGRAAGGYSADSRARSAENGPARRKWQRERAKSRWMGLHFHRSAGNRGCYPEVESEFCREADLIQKSSISAFRPCIFFSKRLRWSPVRTRARFTMFGNKQATKKGTEVTEIGNYPVRSLSACKNNTLLG